MAEDYYKNEHPDSEENWTPAWGGDGGGSGGIGGGGIGPGGPGQDGIGDWGGGWGGGSDSDPDGEDEIDWGVGWEYGKINAPYLKTTSAKKGVYEPVPATATSEQLEKWGKRWNPATKDYNGAQKQAGWRGIIPLENGDVMTEYSVGMEINGQEIEVPLITPITGDEEIELLRTQPKTISDSIYAKARKWAEYRIRKGKSPFYDGIAEDEPLRNIYQIQTSVVSAPGYLRMLGPYILTGSLSCKPIPLLLYIEGDPEHKHSNCVLCKSLDASHPLTMKYLAAEIAACGYFDWDRPGTFTLRAKWQSGHWNHAEISRVKFIIFGVSSGWRTLPLTSWVDIAVITITGEAVFVNGIKGSVTGNSAYLE